MSENKLITLFKQCCDNPDFDKKHPETSLSRGHINYSLEEQPFDMGNKVRAMLMECGYTVKDIGSHYTRVNYGRRFEFDGEPPLSLTRASVDLTLLMDAKHIKLGEVEKDIWIEKKEKYIRETFWKTGGYTTYDVEHTFYKRSVEIFEGIREHNRIQWKANQTEKAFTFCPRSAHRYKQDDCYIVTRNFDSHKASNYWFNRKKYDIIESSHYEHDLHDDAKVMSGLQHDHMKVNGGLLTFGDVWLWLDWKDYQELDKYYKDSIKKTHEVILEQRLKETKNENN